MTVLPLCDGNIHSYSQRVSSSSQSVLIWTKHKSLKCYVSLKRTGVILGFRIQSKYKYIHSLSLFRTEGHIGVYRLHLNAPPVLWLSNSDINSRNTGRFLLTLVHLLVSVLDKPPKFSCQTQNLPMWHSQNANFYCAQAVGAIFQEVKMCFFSDCFITYSCWEVPVSIFCSSKLLLHI